MTELSSSVEGVQRTAFQLEDLFDRSSYQDSEWQNITEMWDFLAELYLSERQYATLAKYFTSANYDGQYPHPSLPLLDVLAKKPRKFRIHGYIARETVDTFVDLLLESHPTAEFRIGSRVTQAITSAAIHYEGTTEKLHQVKAFLHANPLWLEEQGILVQKVKAVPQSSVFADDK